MTNIVDVKKDNSRRKTYIALAGSMVALGSATVGYMMFGLYGGLGFVLLVFGFMWYLQTQLESTIESIEIKVRSE